MSATVGRTGHRESAEIGAFMIRMCRALERRAAAGDLDAVVQLRRLRRQATVSQREAIRGAVAFGHSYGDIAREVGLSRQAIHKAAGTEMEGTP